MKQVDLRRLCTIEIGVPHPHMPAWANLTANVKKGVRRNPGELAGPGIYACFWDGDLIYIGSFSGTTNDPLGGHVIDRAYKHIVGFTLRSDRLFFNAAPLQAIIGGLDHPIAVDLDAALKLGDRVRMEGKSDALGARGAFCATEAKARFAARNWEVLRDIEPDELFERLTFAYRRIIPPASLSSKRSVKHEWIEPIENSLIEKFQPICNTKERRGTEGATAQLAQVDLELERAIVTARTRFAI